MIITANCNNVAKERLADSINARGPEKKNANIDKNEESQIASVIKSQKGASLILRLQVLSMNSWKHRTCGM